MTTKRVSRVFLRAGLGALLLGALPACTTVIINNGGGGGGGGGDSSGSGHHHAIPWRTGFSAGSWAGFVSESYGTQSSSTTIGPAWGGLFYAGFDFGPVFIEWTPTYYAVGKIGTSDGTGNAYYATYTGFEAGLSLRRMAHYLPVEVFAGYDPSGELGFSTGTQAIFDGSALKFGVSVPLFATSPYASLGLRGELRRNFVNLNNSGPVSVSVNSWSYYLGVAFTFAE